MMCDQSLNKISNQCTIKSQGSLSSIISFNSNSQQLQHKNNIETQLKNGKTSSFLDFSHHSWIHHCRTYC